MLIFVQRKLLKWGLNKGGYIMLKRLLQVMAFGALCVCIGLYMLQGLAVSPAVLWAALLCCVVLLCA